jgi:protein-disulfide isomerase
MDNTKNNGQLIPLAIIVAGLLVAGAVYFGGSKAPAPGSLTGQNGAPNTAPSVIAPVSATDHIIGNKNAQVVIVEYSDFECPFCKVFHNTMHQILTTYGDKVAWVYRQFPIAQLHSKAPKESEASECATDQGGNAAFWKFADKIFEITTSNNTLDPAQLPTIASAIGIDVNAFNTCLSSGKNTSLIQADIAAAQKAGAQGTPYSVILVNGKNVGSINGAQPFDQVKSQLDSIIK